MRGKGAALSAAVKNATSDVIDTIDSEIIEPHDRRQLLLQNIAPLYAEHEALIAQLRAIDQFAFFAIQNTWDLRDTTMIRRTAENPRESRQLEQATRIIQQRSRQLRQRISSLTTPRRLDFGGKLTKKQKTAIGTTAALAGLAGMAAASASYNKPPPSLRARASDPPDVAAAKWESMARAERNAKRMQQLHEAQQRSWEKSLYPSNRFYDAETW